MALQRYSPKDQDPWLDNWKSTMERYNRRYWDLDPWISSSRMWDYGLGFPSSYWLDFPRSKRFDMLTRAVEREFALFVPKIGKDGFEVHLDVQQFKPREINVRTLDNSIVIEGRHEGKPDHHDGYISRQFIRRYTLPPGYEADRISSSLSSDGVLTIKGPPQRSWGILKERVIPIHKTGPTRRSIKFDI